MGHAFAGLSAIVRRAQVISAIGSLAVLTACGSGDSGGGTPSANGADNSAALSADLSGQMGSTLRPNSGVMEITISGLNGGGVAQSEVKWLGKGGSDVASVVKTTASTSPVTGFLDVSAISTSTIDVGGFRYIAANFRVRNAPSCGTPGTCTPYASARQNVTFLAVMTGSTINQTAVSRFKKFDGSDADIALTTQLLPAHGMQAGGVLVDSTLASLQVYRESELPAGDPDGVLSVFPYGFVVKNVNDGSRTLPASPASNQYDGVVTFGFRIPLQSPSTNDPFKISMRFQAADDTNLRVTQSVQEQTFAGDSAATTRATSLSGIDLAVLGGRVAQTTIGDPICKVRIAGTAATPTAFLSNNTGIAAAPMNLENVSATTEVSLGFCENMATPSSTTLFVHGSQSGMRKVGAAYAGTITGGGATTRPNQLLWNIASQKPFFIGETVSFSATAGNTTAASAAITPFVGAFRVKGAAAGSLGTFGAATNFALGTLPTAAILGDVNGDGKLDIVAANFTSNSVSVRIGDGAGGISASANFPVGTGPFSVSLGDVNGDGKPDIVAANHGSNNVTVLIGNGLGGFSPSAPLAVGVNPRSATLGDVNGDGKLDIVSANSAGNTVSVLIGNGAGGFAAATNFAVGMGPIWVALADVNGDGKLDIVTANFNLADVSVLIGNGAGGFGAATNFSVQASSTSVALGDVNGDGKLDIVAANFGATTVSVLIGNGTGGFAAATNFGVGLSPNSVALGDVNGDGKLDIVVANFSTSSNSVSVLLGNGTGGFATATNFAVGSAPVTVALGDVNGDGKLDVVAANQNSNNLSVLLGQ